MQLNRILILLLGLLLVCFGQAQGAQWNGYYTDAPGYKTGDTIAIHASLDEEIKVQFRLLRMGAPDKEIARSKIVTVGPHETTFGSFVNFQSVNLSGRSSVSLEGWFLPMITGSDDVVIAGQASSDSGAISIGINSRGYLYAKAWTINGVYKAVRPKPVATGEWHHVATTFDGAFLRLYYKGYEAAKVRVSGQLTNTRHPFRLGARAEAPGDLTGILDGRLDSWAIWPHALSADEVVARKARGISEANPTPDSAEILFYADFEDAYGSIISDSSMAAHKGEIIHHGDPRIAGVHADSHALGLHHDQLVDAGWPVSATIEIPADAPSGLYAVQALIGPDFDVNVQNADVMRGIAIRPHTSPLSTQVAVVLPVNTWMAYNGWPADFWGGKTPDGMTSRPLEFGKYIPGGNNSAYKKMGDGISVSRYQGWRRPNFAARLNSGEDRVSFLSKASISIPLVRWLDAAGIDFDVYTDWDLDRGDFPGFGAYRLMILHGHDEYWSSSMLDTVSGFANLGGSLLHLGGNAVAWKVVITDDGAIEHHKWPVNPEVGELDHYSAVNGERIGYYRAIEQCNASNGDLLFGTANDQIGSSGCEGDERRCRGQWEAENTNHWLWQGIDIAPGDHFGTTLAGFPSVGYETDRFFPFLSPPGLSNGEKVVVLAYGVKEKGYYLQVNQQKLAALGCSFLDSNAGRIFAQVTEELEARGRARTGSIVTYPLKAGGAVLNIPAISTPRALSVKATEVHGDTVITQLASNFINCYAFRKGCPAGIVSVNNRTLKPNQAAPSIVRKQPVASGRIQPVASGRDKQHSKGASNTGRAPTERSGTATGSVIDGSIEVFQVLE